MAKLGDFIESKGNKDVDLIIQEVSLMKQKILDTSYVFSVIADTKCNQNLTKSGFGI